MKKINRHIIDTESLDWIYDDNKEELLETITEAKENSRLVGLVGKRALEYFYNANGLIKFEDYKFFLSTVAKAYKAELDLKLHPNQKVKIVLDESGFVEVMSEVGDGKIEDGEWIRLWDIATILREQNLIECLFQIPIEKITTSTKDDDLIFYEFFKLIYKTDKNNSSRLEKINVLAGRLLGKEINAPDPQTYVAPFIYQVYLRTNVLENVLIQNEKEFNKWLTLAIEYHKKYWGQKWSLNKGGTPLCDKEMGFMSLSLTALCSMAFDKGMKIEVESDYIPKYLYEGTFLKK